MAQTAQAGQSGVKMKNISIIFCFLALCSCNKVTDAPIETANEPKKGEKTIANFDVDVAATDKYRADLKAKFPLETPPENIEKELLAQNYQCGEDPFDTAIRACTNAVPKDKCIEMSIVRTNPYTPDGAQIIKACDVVN